MLIEMSNASGKLIELVNKFEGVRLANSNDALPLAQFINETSMKTGQMRIGFSRGQDYFALLRLQAEKFGALVCEEQGQIVGVGALTTRSSFSRGKKISLGYLQDLRVLPSASRRTRHNFYRFFSEFVRLCPQLSDFDNCLYFVTAILDGNIAAKNVLSRYDFPLEYTKLTNYKAHLWPKPPRLNGIFFTNQDKSNNLSNELLKFYSQTLGLQSFGLSIDDILRISKISIPVTLLEDGEIIAACLLTQGNEERQVFAELSRPNIKIKGPGTYITAMRVSKSLSHNRIPAIRKRLLNKALSISLKSEGLFTGLIECENESLECSMLASLLNITFKGALYRVFHPEHTSLENFSDGFLRPSHVASFDWFFS